MRDPGNEVEVGGNEANVFSNLAKLRAVIGSNLGPFQFHRNDGVLCRINFRNISFFAS